MEDRVTTYVTFGKVARRFGVNPYTVWRWHTAGRGPNRVKLQALKVGGRWKTRWKWVRQFFAALDPEATNPTPPLQTSAARRREIGREVEEANKCVKPWKRL